MASNEVTEVKPGQYNYQNNFLDPVEIGSEGYGKVYKVKDRLEDQIYAIKIIKLEIMQKGKSLKLIIS